MQSGSSGKRRQRITMGRVYTKQKGGNLNSLGHLLLRECVGREILLPKQLKTIYLHSGASKVTMSDDLSTCTHSLIDLG